LRRGSLSQFKGRLGGWVTFAALGAPKGGHFRNFRSFALLILRFRRYDPDGSDGRPVSTGVAIRTHTMRSIGRRRCKVQSAHKTSPPPPASASGASMALRPARRAGEADGVRWVCVQKRIWVRGTSHPHKPFSLIHSQPPPPSFRRLPPSHFS
jgi:hypothetical protein